MSGRISDFAVYEANTAVFYVATAHGGVWKTTNNGATYEALFQDMGLMSIGAVAVSQKDPNLLWVGTGEGNNRQSTSWGSGIYKSTDGGKTFKLMGLSKSYHINRVVIDPQDNNVVLVAAQGALFGPGGDRGVFKTTDGGATWKQVIKVDDDTGANDLVMAATDHRTLYASTYQRRRSQCCMNGGGPGSGVWKSTDGGDTWTRLNGGGLPAGSLGRIGLDVYRRSANIIYASIEAAAAEAAAGGGRGGGAANAPGGGESGVYRSDDGGTTWRKVNANNPRPMYFSQVRIDPGSPDHILLGGVRLTISLDGGRTQLAADPAAHDDKHAIWWDPNNSEHVMIGTDGGVYSSYDMTRSWMFHPNLPVGLFYHVGYDQDTPFNVCGGMQDNYDWCGPSQSRFSRGIAADEFRTVQGGDGFVAIIDQRDSRIIYSESQDGNMTRKNKVTGESKSIRPTPQNVVNAQAGDAAFRFHWDTPLLFSPNDPGTLLVGGNKVFKSTDRGDTWTAISPDLTTNANRNDIVTMGVKNSDIRMSKDDGVLAWPAIVALAESAKQPGLYYTGTDDGVVSVSKDGGKTWTNITDKLPGLPKGAFISEVVPSRFDAGTVYVTSDAHRLNDYETHMWVSNDFGATFRSLNGNLAGEAVKTLTEDQKNPDVLYIGTETGIFLTLDRGKSWARLKANLPTVRVDEITLHPRDNAMLVATHGRNLWVLDHLEPIQEYAAAQAAAAGAHLFAVPNALEWKTKDDRNDEFWGHQFFTGENPPTDAVIQFYLKSAVTDAKLKITDAAGKDVRELTVPANRMQPGMQTVCWDLRVEPLPPVTGAPGAGAAVGGGGGGGGRAGGGGGAGRGGAAAAAGGYVATEQPAAGYLPANPCGAGGGGRGGGGGFGGGGVNAQGPHVMPGTYNVALVIGGKTIDTKPMKVVMDPAVQFSDVQRKRYNDIVTDLHDMQRRGTQAASALAGMGTQMTDIAGKIKDMNNVPAAVKTQFDALNKEFESVRSKLGSPFGAIGGGRGGAGGGRAGGGAGPAGAVGGRGQAAGRAGGGGAAQAAAEPAAPEANANAEAAPGAQGAGAGGFGAAPGDPSLITRVATLKNQIMSIWEMPSDTYVKQYNDLKISVPKAIADANAFLLKAMTLSTTLSKYNLTLTVPAPVK